MSNTQEEIQFTSEQVEKAILTGDALKRLFDNPDFKLVITEGFLKDEALRLVMLKGDRNFLTGHPERKEFINNRLQAIAEFNIYMREVAQNAGFMYQLLEEQKEVELDEDEA